MIWLFLHAGTGPLIQTIWLFLHVGTGPSMAWHEKHVTLYWNANILYPMTGQAHGLIVVAKTRRAL